MTAKEMGAGAATHRPLSHCVPQNVLYGDSAWRDDFLSFRVTAIREGRRNPKSAFRV